jgi:lipopolysaccharide transport system ATP-binding protein
MKNQQVMNDNIISTRNLGKKYFISRRRNAKEYLAAGIRTRFFLGLGVKKDVWALQNINLTIPRGVIAAVMGPNGSGKSTLLRLISDISDPSEGEIIVNGSVTPMLEAGVGFHPELTGRENIRLNAALMGLNGQGFREKFADIVDFSEIGQYLDVPLKRYSTGMIAKLAFSVATHQQKDILIIDEVLSVNDAAFREKSILRLQQLVQRGITILMVSHDNAILERLCDYGVLLNQGRLVDQGCYLTIRKNYSQVLNSECVHKGND